MTGAWARCCVAALLLLPAATLRAQAKTDASSAHTHTPRQKVNAHIRMINELGLKLKKRMRTGFPAVQTKEAARDVVDDTFCDIVRFKAHYVLGRRHAKQTADRPTQRMRVRGMKNAYFPGDFFDYFPLIERLQRHVQRFHIQVDALDWYARFERTLEADIQGLQRHFETDPATYRDPPGVVPIRRAIEGGLAEAVVSGDGRVTSRINVQIRNRGDQELTVRVPPWTALIPDSPSRQILVIRQPVVLTIPAGEVRTVAAVTVCADLRTKDRPAGAGRTYRFAPYPDARGLAAIQNIIGIADLADVKGEYRQIHLPSEIRGHVLTQCAIWRYLARAGSNPDADISEQVLRNEIARLLGEDPEQTSQEESGVFTRDLGTILERIDSALRRLDI